MTDYRPLTPTQCESEIRRLSNKIESQTADFGATLEAAANAEVDYEIAYAKALLAAKGETVSEREANATLATEDELRTKKTTAAVAKAADRGIKTTDSQLTAVESANRNVRKQAGLD